MNIVKKELETCPICGSSRVTLVADETNKNPIIHCSGCHWTFLPRESWDLDEMVRRYNARVDSRPEESGEEDDLEELLAQCLRFRGDKASNTSLYPLEGREE